MTMTAESTKRILGMSKDEFMQKSLWVAKMTWGRMVGTYAEVGHYWNDEDCKDLDLSSSQPDDVQAVLDHIDRMSGGKWMTIPEMFEEYAQ